MNDPEKIKKMLEKKGRLPVGATPFLQIDYPCDKLRGFQGGCSDGVRYFYQTVMHYDFPSRERDYCRIAKVDLQTGQVMKWSDDLYLDHANDITYHPSTNRLLVCHNKPRGERISLLDADTLTLVGSHDLPFAVYGIAYSARLDRFAVGLSGKREFRFLKGDLTPADDRTYRTAPETDRYTKQGIGTDGELLYFVLWDGKHKDAPDFQNTVAVYDFSGAYRGRLDFNVGVQEPESIDVANGKLYAVCGHSHPILYRLTPNKPL